jgi:hypothetical protein
MSKLADFQARLKEGAAVGLSARQVAAVTLGRPFSPSPLSSPSPLPSPDPTTGNTTSSSSSISSNSTISLSPHLTELKNPTSATTTTIGTIGILHDAHEIDASRRSSRNSNQDRNSGVDTDTIAISN